MERIKAEEKHHLNRVHQGLQNDLRNGSVSQAYYKPTDYLMQEGSMGYDSQPELRRIKRPGTEFGNKLPPRPPNAAESGRVNPLQVKDIPPPLMPAYSPRAHTSRKQKCYASGHRNCSPTDKSKERNQHPQSIYDEMRLMDQEFRARQHKNLDHFHLVKANEIYDILKSQNSVPIAAQFYPLPQYIHGLRQGEQLTATIYSEDSNRYQEQKESQAQYAQILINQMNQKKEKKLQEQKERISLAADINSRQKLDKIVIPDIPTHLDEQEK